MQLKISRSGGNYLVLNLKGAVLTHFADPGPDSQVELRLIDGKEGDDQFRKFLAQVMEDEDQPKLFDAQIGGGIRINAQADKVRELEEENAELRRKVDALSEQIDGFAREKPITELKSCVAAPIAVDVLETNVPRAGRVRTEHIFAGKSRSWLEGFAACRWWRLEIKDCEDRGDTQEPARPENPYANRPIDHNRMRSWGAGWSECLDYTHNRIPDPTSHLEKAK